MANPVGQFVLEEGQRTMLALCLGIAIEKFGEHVKLAESEAARFRAMAEGRTVEQVYQARSQAVCMDRLAQQFRDQIAEATALRLRLESADTITVGTVVEEEEEGDDLCDKCGRSGVQVNATDSEGNTLCVDCERDQNNESSILATGGVSAVVEEEPEHYCEDGSHCEYCLTHGLPDGRRWNGLAFVAPGGEV